MHLPTKSFRTQHCKYRNIPCLLWSLAFLLQSVGLQAIQGSFSTQPNYFGMQKKSELYSKVQLKEDSSFSKKWSYQFQTHLESYRWQKNTENRLLVEEAYIQWKPSYSFKLSMGWLSPNLNHVDFISSLSGHQSYSMLQAFSNQRIASPGVHLKKSSDSVNFELLYQVKKTRNKLLPQFSPWLPGDVLTEIDQESGLLLLPEDAEFYYVEQDDIRKARQNNLFLKASVQSENLLWGAFAFYGSSTPQIFFDINASLLRIEPDGKKVYQTSSEIGIRPQYFPELHWGHFGEWAGESLIVKWELSHQQDLSKEDNIALYQKVGILNLEWSTPFWEYDLIHNLSYYGKYRNTSSGNLYSDPFQLLSKNIIYNLILSKASRWQLTQSLNLKVDAPKALSLSYIFSKRLSDSWDLQVLASKFSSKEQSIYKSLERNSFVGTQIRWVW